MRNTLSRPGTDNACGKRKSRSESSYRRHGRPTMTAILSLLALTRSTVDCFVPMDRDRRQMTTQTTQSPFRFSGDFKLLPTFTSLGYEHDKSLDTNLEINSEHNSFEGQISKPLSSSNATASAAPTTVTSSAKKQRKKIRHSNQHVNIRYRGTWYDVTKWRKAHSAGAHWLDWFDGRDATEIIDALHSTHSRMMTTRLPKSKPEWAAQLEAKAAPDSKVQIQFRKLFDKLLADGWWKRDMGFELQQLGIWASLFFGAVATIKRAPYVSFVLLGLSFVGAGWLSHDYIHGLDPFAKKLRLLVPWMTGFSPRWWSDKHNKHHALTNEIGVDEDMATDPVLYTWAPDPSQDSFIRKIQHYVFWIPFTFLYFAWRLDSFVAAVHAVELKRPASKRELYSILGHYVLLFNVFPVNIWVPSFLLSGLVSALVVTSTHQSEEKFTAYQADHVTRQFLCTRSVVMSNPISAWIWGGMQYQIEHHLFPTIPRSKLPELKPIIQKFAEDNTIDGGYRESGELEILKMNWKTYRAVAHAEPVEGAPLTTGKVGQQAAIINGFTAVNPFHRKGEET